MMNLFKIIIFSFLVTASAISFSSAHASSFKRAEVHSETSSITYLCERNLLNISTLKSFGGSPDFHITLNGAVLDLSENKKFLRIIKETNVRKAVYCDNGHFSVMFANNKKGLLKVDEYVLFGIEDEGDFHLISESNTQEMNATLPK